MRLSHNTKIEILCALQEQETRFRKMVDLNDFSKAYWEARLKDVLAARRDFNEVEREEKENQ